jgi:Cu/Ag efflux pump CusA
VSATLVIMLVFLPLLFLEGLEGRLLEPLAIAYLLAIGASLIVAITVTPVLCLVLLPRGMEKRARRAEDPEPPPLRWLHRGYEPLLRFSLRRPVVMAGMGVLVTGIGAAGLFGLGRSFLPKFNEGSLTIAAVTQPGTSLEQSDALARMAERELMEDPAVVSTSRRTGRAERSEHVQGPESSEIDVQLRADDRTREELFEDVRERLSSVPGMRFNVGQPISHRIDHMVSGQRAALSIKVVGEDLDVLRRKAKEVRAALDDVRGLVDLRVEQMVDIPQIVARVDEQAAAEYGLSPGQAASALGTALWGQKAGRIYEDGVATEVVVRFSDAPREDLQAVRDTRIPTPSGATVPASALADIERGVGPNYVLREDVRRRVVVSANVSGRDPRSAYEQVRRVVDEEVEMPEGAHIEYAGQFEREEATGQRLLWLSVLVVLGIALIVGTTLGSTRRTLIVLANLPLALAGGVAGVYLAGGVLSVASMIGFITLFGIATRNGILLATRTRDLELEQVPQPEAVARASRERLAPILMTALTAALGLLPLALALGQPGSEIQAPMAIVILCGLVTSTALNMMVVPALLARWGGGTAGGGATERAD